MQGTPAPAGCTDGLCVSWSTSLIHQCTQMMHQHFRGFYTISDTSCSEQPKSKIRQELEKGGSPQGTGLSAGTSFICSASDGLTLKHAGWDVWERRKHRTHESILIFFSLTELHVNTSASSLTTASEDPFPLCSCCRGSEQPGSAPAYGREGWRDSRAAPAGKCCNERVSVWLQAMASVCACEKMTREPNRAAPGSFVLIFLREGNEKQPGERN